MLQTSAISTTKRAKLVTSITAIDLLSTMRRTKKRQYHVFANADSRAQIDAVRQGLPARFLSVMSADMRVSKEQLFDWANIPRATANRKIAADATLTVDESERTFCIAKLIGIVAAMVGSPNEAEAGNVSRGANKFDAAIWTAQWLREANHALGGAAPSEYLDTAEGRALVAQLMMQMESGAYA